MPMQSRLRCRVVLLAAWLATSAVHAQGVSTEHLAHHPGVATQAPEAGAMASGGDDPMGRMPLPDGASRPGSPQSTPFVVRPPAAQMPGMAAATGMVAMPDMAQGCCGPGQGDLLYPSLIGSAALAPQQRAVYEARARERVIAGVTRLQQAQQRLGQAAAAGNADMARLAAQDVRAALGLFEAGLATYAMLAGDATPNQVALGWFRKEMGLPATADPSRPDDPPHGLFGLTSFHYFVMLALVALAATLLWIHLQRSRRTTALLARLATGGSAAPAAPAPQPAAAGSARAPAAAGLAGRDAAAGSPPGTAADAAATATAARVDPTTAPSAPNSWSGLLQVAQIFGETAQVKTFRLVDPAAGKLPFSYLPGQFLTVTVAPDGQAVRRSYTIASAPTRRDYCEITVRREEHGIVSGYLHDKVHRGELLQIMAPAGRFTFTGEEADSVVLVAGGVGITPMMSVIRYLTDRCWPGQIHLVYGCRADDDMIYREEIEYLQRRFPNLRTTLVAGRVKGTAWPHRTGRITKELLAEVVPAIASKRIHVCGPGPMMAAIKQSLRELGVPAENIKTEAFIGTERPAVAPLAPVATPAAVPDATAEGEAPSARPAAPAATTGAAALPGARAVFARSNKTAALAPGQTILEAAEDVGVAIDYACRVGTCGACRVRLLSGTVTMEVEDGLEPSDKADHIVLACQAKSTGDVTVDA